MGVSAGFYPPVDIIFGIFVDTNVSRGYLKSKIFYTFGFFFFVILYIHNLSYAICFFYIQLKN